MKENLIDNFWSDFLINPLNVIDRLYNQMDEIKVDEFHNLIKNQLKEILETHTDKLDKIPLLNSRNLSYDNIRNKSLVRYKCMVQDMFNPEIYAAVLKSENKKKINLYNDSIILEEKFSVNPNKNFIMDRFIYYMISIPGVNEWVKECWDKESKIDKKFLDNKNFKRSIENTNDLVMTNKDEDCSISKKKKISDVTEDVKKTNTNVTEDEKNTSSNIKKNFCSPIKEEEGLNKPIILKIYDTQFINLKLNDIVDVVGIIEFPSFENQEPNDNKTDINCMMNNLDLDHQDYLYPEIPRIHAICYKQVNDLNPVAKNDLDIQSISKLRLEMLNFFEKVFLGDKLVTEYFICWLISKVFKIQDLLPIGNFPINISNLSIMSENDQKKFIKQLYEIIEKICTHSFNFPVTIDKFNSLFFNSYIEKDNTKLQAGFLQLPSNFSLVLDETCLQSGSLKELGLKNLSLIRELASWQTVEYDHFFFTQKINTDINLLVLSEGKSLFEVWCEIKLKSSETNFSINAVIDYISKNFNENLQNDFRKYLSTVRNLSCEIPEDLKTKIQDDFVEMRKTSFDKSGSKINSEDLHKILSLSRLLAMSEGSKVINEFHWEKAKKLEIERRERLK